MSPTAQLNPSVAYPPVVSVRPPALPTTTRPIEPAARSTNDHDQRELPDPSTPRIVQLIQLSAREYAKLLTRLIEQQERYISPLPGDQSGPEHSIDRYA